MLKAITRSARLVDKRVASINKERAIENPPKAPISIGYFFDHYATDEYTRVVVAEEDFYGAQRELVPSVSVEELKHYEGVRKEFEGGKEKEVKTANPVGVTANGTTSRAQFEEMMKQQLQRAAHEAREQENGSGRPNGSTRAPALDRGNEDDYIIKTDELSLYGPGKSKSNGKGKGKSKGKVHIAEPESNTFGDAAADDDMYA